LSRSNQLKINQASDILPSVTILITAHNEEAVVRDRIQNCLEQDYPGDRLEIIVASDHSTDQTDEIVQSFGNPVRLVRGFTGRGKSLTQNDAIPQARGDIVILTDASTKFAPEFLKKIVAPFADAKVGCVTGHVVWKNSVESTHTESGDSYWHFEHSLWRAENLLGVAFTGSGSCLAFRKSLFRPIEAFYGDDTVLPLDIVLQGYRVQFQDDALAYDDYFSELRSEFRSRVRMSLRGLSGTLSRHKIFNPLRHGFYGPVILSHKIFRYGTPYFLLIAFFCNLVLLRTPTYKWIFIFQFAFYVSSIVGLMLDRFSIRLPLISTAYSFVAANLGLLFGVTKALFGARVFAYKS
jgi:cellulose synthase/poly-beta-1,6-N-acetylglucosamine synthase-like glycosyltransferase